LFAFLYLHNEFKYRALQASVKTTIVNKIAFICGQCRLCQFLSLFQHNYFKAQYSLLGHAEVTCFENELLT